MIRIAFIVAFMAIGCAAGIVQAEPRPKAEANVADAVIRLGDLFDGIGDLAGREVGPAPAPGSRAVYRANHLAAIARAHGIAWQPSDQMVQAVVSRDAATLGHAAVLALLRGEFRRQGAPERMNINLTGGGDGIPLPRPGTAPSVESLIHDRAGGAFTAHIRLDDNDHAAQRTVHGRVEFLIRVPVPARMIRRGETVARDDIQWREINLRQLAADPVDSADQIVGRAARRTLRLTQPVRSSDLRAPIVIDKGALVTIVLNSPGIRLTSTGRALEDGADGEMIRVINMQSKRTVEATVIAKNLVRVALHRRIAAAASR